MARPEKHIFVCTHTRPSDHPKGSCDGREAQTIRDGFAKIFEDRDLWNRFKLTQSSCLGVCEHGPAVLVYPEGVIYAKVRSGDIATIVDEHLLGGEPVESLKIDKAVWD